MAGNNQTKVTTVKEEINKNEVIDIKSKPLAVADNNQPQVTDKKEDSTKNEVIEIKLKPLATENQPSDNVTIVKGNGAGKNEVIDIPLLESLAKTENQIEVAIIANKDVDSSGKECPSNKSIIF